MNKEVVLFGLRDYAEMAHYYLENDTDYTVVAFSVNENYIPESKHFKGLPVYPFESIEKDFPPSDYSFFAPMSPKRMNKLRERIYYQIKEKGYTMINYVSSKANFMGDKIGENCFILEDNTIQPFVEIGNNVVIWGANFIAHHSIVRDHVTVTTQVAVSGHCDLGANSFLGTNSSLRDGVRLAEGTLVAMSASIIRDTEEWGVYKGVPAKKMEGKPSYEIL